MDNLCSSFMSSWLLNGSVGKESTCHAWAQETRVPSLGQEDPLEEEMTTHPRILAWAIPWAEGAGDSKESDRTEHRTASGQAGGSLPHMVLLSLFPSAGCFKSG